MNPSEDQIEVKFAYAELPLKKLFGKVQLLNGPNRLVSVLVAVIWWIVLLVLIVGIFQLAGGYPMDGLEFVVFGFSLGVLSTVVVLALLHQPRVNRTLAALTTSRSRRDGLTMTLDGTGVTLQGTGHNVFQSWRTVEDVLVIQNVTLIMPSRAEFYPVPHEYLPPGIDAEDLARRIAGWRAASA